MRSVTELDPNVDEGWLHRQGLGPCFLCPRTEWPLVEANQLEASAQSSIRLAHACRILQHTIASGILHI